MSLWYFARDIVPTRVTCKYGLLFASFQVAAEAARVKFWAAEKKDEEDVLPEPCGVWSMVRPFESAQRGHGAFL